MYMYMYKCLNRFLFIIFVDAKFHTLSCITHLLEASSVGRQSSNRELLPPVNSPFPHHSSGYIVVNPELYPRMSMNE